MNLERPFRISMLVLVLTGLLAITLALASLVWLLVAFGGLAVIVVWTALQPSWQLPRLLATVIVISSAMVVVIESILAETVLVPAAHFLIVTQLVWLTQERSNRHYGWLCLMSLLQMMLAGVLSVDLAFGLSFLLYLPAGVVALLLYNLRCELERHGELRPSRMPRIGLRLLAGAAVVTLAELALTAVVFMYFPRFGIQILPVKPLQRGRRLTGFSDRVRFGELASVRDNPEVVMSVRLLRDGEPVQAERFPLLLRGISLDTYQYSVWTTRDYIPDSALHALPFPHRPGGADPERDIVQDISLEPVNTKVLFYLPEFQHIRSATPNLDEIDYHRESGTISSVRGNGVSIRYIVRSRIPAWTMAELSRPAGPSLEQYERRFERYIQLPESITAPQRPERSVARLARRIVADIPEREVYRRARTVEVYLKGEYRYSQKPSKHELKEDPVEHFLFDSGEGHCEHFAAAMAVMLRTLKIPSRVVVGFSGGEWNEYGQFYIIRQRNAHAWVEVRIPGLGHWVTFDPTPPSESAPSYGPAWLARLSRRLAYARLWWNNHVVNFSSRDQRRLAATATRFLSRLPNYLPLWGRDQFTLDAGYAAGLGGALVVGAVLLVVGVYLLVAYLLGTRLSFFRRRRKRGAGVPSVGFYRKMLDLLRRRGFQRDPATTPREFAHAVVETGGEPYRPVATVTDAFCRVRYGGERLKAQERSEVHRALAQLEGARRK